VENWFEFTNNVLLCIVNIVNDLFNYPKFNNAIGMSNLCQSYKRLYFMCIRVKVSFRIYFFEVPVLNVVSLVALYVNDRYKHIYSLLRIWLFCLIPYSICINGKYHFSIIVFLSPVLLLPLLSLRFMYRINEKYIIRMLAICFLLCSISIICIITIYI